MAQKSDEQYSPEEAKKRMEAAIRGARLAGHKSMADIPKKGPHRAGKMILPESEKRPKKKTD
jgi:hypothetical protein